MTTVILTMTDNVVKGFNRLPEGGIFHFFISAQASLTRTSVGHRKIEKSLVCGDSVWYVWMTRLKFTAVQPMCTWTSRASVGLVLWRFVEVLHQICRTTTHCELLHCWKTVQHVLTPENYIKCTQLNHYCGQYITSTKQIFFSWRNNRLNIERVCLNVCADTEKQVNCLTFTQLMVHTWNIVILFLNVLCLWSLAVESWDKIYTFKKCSCCIIIMNIEPLFYVEYILHALSCWCKYSLEHQM